VNKERELLKRFIEIYRTNSPIGTLKSLVVDIDAELAKQVDTNWIDNVVRDIAELPDRTSPEDWPEAMLVTAIELTDLIKSRAPSCTESRPYNDLPKHPKFNAFIRAFWRRIDAHKNDFSKELPEEMPVQFRASMETALLVFDKDKSR
jgi:hypothetical protein